MTREEMENTMQFILAEQAKVTIGLEQVADKVSALTGTVRTVTDNTAQLQRMMISMTELFNRERKDLRNRLTALTDAQIRAQEEMKEFRLENRQFRADVGQAMTMLENSQDRLAEAMIESEKWQQRAAAKIEALAES